jgi:hypothetical protein
MGGKATSKCASATTRAYNAPRSAANRAVKSSTAAAKMGSATAAEMASTAAASMTAALRHNARDHCRRAEHDRCSNSKYHPTHQTHLSIIRAKTARPRGTATLTNCGMAVVGALIRIK